MPKWGNEVQHICFLIFSSLFIISSLFNIMCGFFEKEKARRISKPFCLIFLGIAAAIALPRFFLIYCGCFLGSIGDFLLLYKSNKKCKYLTCAAIVGDTSLNQRQCNKR